MKYWILLCLTFIMGMPKAAELLDDHPYHVGSVEIKYNENTQTFQVTAKFFLDDLEDVINLYQNNPLYFHKPEQNEMMHQALEQYTTQHMMIKSNKQVINLQFLGYEAESESVYIYLESKTCPKPSEVKIGVNALYDLFDDQINIVHVTVNGKRKSHKLDYPDIYFTELWLYD